MTSLHREIVNVNFKKSKYTKLVSTRQLV